MKKALVCLLTFTTVLGLSGCSSPEVEQSELTVEQAAAALDKLGDCESVETTYYGVNSVTEIICMSGGFAATWIEVFYSEAAKDKSLKVYECDPENYSLDEIWIVGPNWYLSFAERQLEKLGSNLTDFQNELGGQAVTFSSFCS